MYEWIATWPPTRSQSGTTLQLSHSLQIKLITFLDTTGQKHRKCTRYFVVYKAYIEICSYKRNVMINRYVFDSGKSPF